MNLNSEKRRAYFIALAKEVQVISKVDARTARTVVAALVELVQHKVHAAKKIDLGFAVIEPQETKPAIHRTRFKKSGDKNAVYMTGVGVKWRIRIHKSWLRKTRPHWSRPV